MDTEYSLKLRGDLATINGFYKAAFTRVSIANLDPRRIPPFRPFVRIFAGPPAGNHGQPFPSDPKHGRLYWGNVGGWHQGLPKEKRGHIRIDGERVVLLDFSSMHLRLAYAELGIECPHGADLYDVNPALCEFRDGVKAVCSAMLSRSGQLKALNSETRALIPSDWTGPMVRDAIIAAHPRIAHLFGAGKGLHFMFLDSSIMVAVLLTLAERDIVGLPLHDGLLVKESVAAEVKQVMRDCAEKVVGVEFPVSIKLYNDKDRACTD